MTYIIEKNIPAPIGAGGRGVSKGELRLTMEKMEVGDSFLAPNMGSATVSGRWRPITLETGKKFTSRRVEGGVRVWRLE